MPERDLALLTEAARAAGRIALRFWQNGPQVWDKGTQGPVTEADLAVNDMLQQQLRAARPDYGWLSEETPDDAARLNCDRLFIIDPIDGTRAFIAGERHFSHSLAVAQGGRITAAVVYLPALDRLYSASATGPALLNGSVLQASSRLLADKITLLTSKLSLAPDHWHSPMPEFQRGFRASIAYRLSLVAEGAFDGMLSFHPTWEWDIAAGALIAERAGARVSDRRGAPLRFNSAEARSDGILACGAGLHQQLLGHFKA